MIRVTVHVRLKQGILDPQGQAIQRVLTQSGQSSVTDVRQGKVFDLSLDTASPDQALAMAHSIASELLANPVMESFSVALAA